MPYRAGELRAPHAPRRSRGRWALAIFAYAPFALAFFVLAAWIRLPPRSPRSARRSTTRPPLPALTCVDMRYAESRSRFDYDAVCGPLRLTYSLGRPLEVAVQRFASDIAFATPVRGGWVFVTADGTVTRSDTFLGPLHILGRVPCFDRLASSHSAGRIAVVGARGGLWTTDGATPLVRWTFRGRVVSAAFSDAAHGAVVLDHGELLVTRDAGRSWPRVDLQGEVAWQVELTSRGIVAATTAGTQLLTTAGPRRVGVTLRDDEPHSTLDQIHWGSSPHEAILAASVRAQELFQVAAVDYQCPAPPAARTEPAPDYPPFPFSTEAPPYHCDVASRGRTRDPSRDVRPLPGAPRGGEYRTPMVTASGRVDANAWWTRDRHPRMGLAWSGRDASGPFTGHAGPAIEGWWKEPSQEFAPPQGMLAVVEAISRGGLLVSAPSLTPSLFWARPGAAVVSLERPGANSLGRGSGDHPGSMSAALPDGAVALLQWSRGGSGTVVSAVEMGPDGRLRQHRGLIDDRASTIALGRWEGALGIVLWNPDGVRQGWFHPFAGGGWRALPRPPMVAPRACESDASVSAPDTITLWLGRLDLAFLASPAGSAPARSPRFASATRYEVEWTSGAMCVRAVTLNRSEDPRQMGDATMTLDARPGDRFEGSLDDAGIERVSCRVHPGVSPPVAP